VNKQAFDVVADQYDQEFTHTSVGHLQRQQVYYQLKKILEQHKIQQVLELNCGTGEDAIWLAERGLNVHATDIAPKMVEVARQKGERLFRDQQNTGTITYQTLDSNRLSDLSDEIKYDLIFSNFGGLNCLSAEQLQQFSAECAKKLAHGGLVIAVVMSNFCWWETLYFLLKRNWKQAWRRRSKTAIAAPLDEHTTIDTWYYSPAGFNSLFSPHFSTQCTIPIGFWLPPSYLDPFFANKQYLLSLMNGLENRSSRFSSLAGGADHFLLVLKKNHDLGRAEVLRLGQISNELCNK
jgi:SAM-dependent methyltransferase